MAWACRMNEERSVRMHDTIATGRRSRDPRGRYGTIKSGLTESQKVCMRRSMNLKKARSVCQV